MRDLDYPVDLVYLWCDIADPTFRAKRNEYAARFGIPLCDDSNGEARYRSNDELRYSLRSAELYVPWVRKVFICIDDDQTPPSWLNLENPKLRIVRHGEFIPQQFLPVFNSSSIEHFLWRIPDLAEHFLFSNDDMLFGRVLSKDFFFAENAKPYCRFRDLMPAVDADSTVYRKSLENSAGLMRELHVELKDDVNAAMSRWPHHNIDAYVKSDLAKVHGIFREQIEATLRNPFRAEDNIQRVLFEYYGIQSFGWHYRQVCRSDPESLEAQSYWNLAYAIGSDLRPGLFCFNDNERLTDYERSHGMRLISGLLLPAPSGFEILEAATEPVSEIEREAISNELKRYCAINDRDNYGWSTRMVMLRLRNEPILPSGDPRISVILPVHNAEDNINNYIANVLSVKESSYIEVICVDDGSTDDSLELMQEWASVAPNLHIVTQGNLGLEAARKAGLAVAKGKKSVFLDPTARLMHDSALLHVQRQPDIKPAFAENNIPVVVATDENYLEYTKVLLRSIVATTSSNVDFLIFYNDIAEGKRREFAEIFSRQENLSVRFIDMADCVKSSRDAGFVGKRYPASSCFRAYAPYVLTEFDKAVYLDIDTVVRHDIADLCRIDIGDSLLGGVIDVVNSASVKTYADFALQHGFVEWDKYVNTGVLLMNFKAFRDCGILDDLLKIMVASSQREFWPDQDALNFVCKGRIRELDPKWNVQVGDYCIARQLEITKDAAFVYHFTAAQKPWSHLGHRYAPLWWRHVEDPDFAAAQWRRVFGGGGDAVMCGEGIAVTVVVPVYSAARYLFEALASLLAQTLRNIEVVCVDDGSTDCSRAIVQTLQKLDSRVKLLSQYRQGPGVARNAALDVAAGEYIYFLDADDRIAPGDALLRAYEQIRRDRLDILLAAASTIAEDGSLLREDGHLDREHVPGERVFPPDALGAALFLCAPMAPWGKLYRRAFLEENKLRFPALKRSETIPMVGLALSLSSRIGVLAQPIYERRTGVASSPESTKDETPLDFFEVEQMLRDSLRERNLWDRFKAAVYSAFVSNLAYNLRAVRRYSSFRSIVARYRQERQQWICWELVALPEMFAKSVQLVKDIEADMDDDEQIAMFVRLREETAGKSPEIKSLRADNKRLCASLAAEKAKVARQAARLQARVRALKGEVAALRGSESYRVGLFVTWPARKVWGGIKCLRENGVKYTLKHAAGKMLRRSGLKSTW